VTPNTRTGREQPDVRVFVPVRSEQVKSICPCEVESGRDFQPFKRMMCPDLCALGFQAMMTKAIDSFGDPRNQDQEALLWSEGSTGPYVPENA